MKLPVIFTLVLTAFCQPSSHAQTYLQEFTLTDGFGMSPYRAQNAFLRTEPFGTPVRYWQPSTPNVWGEVIYRFDVGAPIQTASMFMSVVAYTSGADVNFDNGAQAYLDISTDDVNYINLLGKFPGNGGGVAGPGDITSFVSGSDVIYVRSRLFMTVEKGAFGTAQFLRSGPGGTFNVTAATVPEPSTLGLLSVAAVACFLRRRR